MRLGQLTAVQVEDVTLWVALNWGQLKALQTELQQIDESNALAVCEFVETKLLEFVKGIEGLEDTTGMALVALTPEIVAQLDPDFLGEAFKAMLSIGERTDDAKNPTLPS